MRTVYGVKMNISRKQAVAPGPLDFSQLAQTAQKFGQLADYYRVLDETYNAGLTVGVIEGGKLGIARGHELSEEETKLAVEDITKKAKTAVKTATTATAAATKKVAKLELAIRNKNAEKRVVLHDLVANEKYYVDSAAEARLRALDVMVIEDPKTYGGLKVDEKKATFGHLKTINTYTNIVIKHYQRIDLLLKKDGKTK